MSSGGSSSGKGVGSRRGKGQEGRSNCLGGFSWP
jgi:hypothetical protein